MGSISRCVAAFAILLTHRYAHAASWIISPMPHFSRYRQYGRGQGAPVASSPQASAHSPPDIEKWANGVIEWVDDQHRQRSTKSPFAIEKQDACQDGNCTPFEWIEGLDSLNVDDASNDNISNEIGKRRVALRTLGTEPLLDAKAIAAIRASAHSQWDAKDGHLSSRFTLQNAKTNSECHLDELVAADSSGALKESIDTMLTTKIYPLVRSAFGKKGLGAVGGGSLCVYDSLVIRYNGDKAKGTNGASQPLHRDGGMVSVNIALNSQEGDGAAGGFEGGGTFFEGLIQYPAGKSSILRPVAPGHVVAHLSTERHAGAPTTSGIREILVFFLTTRQLEPPRAPPVERAFLLKMAAKDLVRPAAIKCLQLAIKESPQDGEAHFWKGFHLMRNSNGESSERRWHEINQGVFHHLKAKECSPFDARIRCYAAMARKQRFAYAQRTKQDDFLLRGDEELEHAIQDLRACLILNEAYREYDISGDFDVAVALVNLGEICTQLRRYKDAVQYLVQVENNTQGLDEDMKTHVIVQARELLARCPRGLADEKENTTKDPASRNIEVH